MKRYLAVFTGSPSALARWETIPESERQKRQAEGVTAWKKWATENSASIVEMGGPSAEPSWSRLTGSATFATTWPRSQSSKRSRRTPQRGCS
jgi:hypothetical protein